jgi:hypothetical protein
MRRWVVAALGLLACAHPPPPVPAARDGARVVLIPMVRARRPAQGESYLAHDPVCAPCARARRDDERLVRCGVVSDARGPLVAEVDASTAESWMLASYGVVCRFEQERRRAE